MQRTLRFPRRERLDGSYASICPHCFVTVGTACSNEDETLSAAEKRHVCDPATLAWLSDMLAHSRGKWKEG
ncbi:MAG: hypothetical protein ABSG84_19330 [Acidobacteriaceae bacterium]|jgi:hypothetical protein